ncbi:MAG: ATP-dependent helicase UvrD/PcrA, partial [Actinomycetota bacterium]|nr:ATP-dependent helicase UvrD/PcrA [Actinomycetota bacterium]
MTATPAPAIDPEVAERLMRALGLQLTAEQRQVVFGAPDGPAVVIAGAGSGKTAVMAARIAVLVATGTVPGEAILGLTFTRKAAAELAERVDVLLRAARRARVIDPMGGEPEISTYHSFAQRFVREHGIWVGIDPDLRVESDFALLPLAYRVAARSGALNDADHDFTLPTAVTAMRTLDAALAEHVVDTQRLREHEATRQQAMATARDNDQIRRLLAASRSRVVASHLVDDWRRAKSDAGVMDYADMMRLAHLTASGSDEAVQRCRVAYRAVLLDEYQDTSVVQRKLLQQLFGDGHRLLAVGDPKQSIYAFRGAAAASMQAFIHHFPAADGSPAPVYALTANFRSGATIVEVANAAAATQRAARTGSPGSLLRVGRTDLQDTVEVHTFRAAADESRFVVAQVAKEVAQGRSPEEVIVLARSNSDVATYAGALAAAGIPVTSSDQAGLFELPEVADVLAVLAVVVDPSANAELMRLLTGPRWAIGLRDLALLGARARQLAGPPWRAADDAEVPEQLAAATAGSDPVELPSLADALADPGDAAFSGAALQRFDRLHAELDSLARHAGEPVPDLIGRILRVTGMDTELLLGDGAVSRLAAVEALLSVAGQFQVGDPAAGAAGFLRAVRLAGQADADPGFDPPLPAGCVRVMTVHKAKGLQAEVVLLPGFTEAAYDKVALKDHWTTTPGSLPDDLRGDLPGPAGSVAAPATSAEVAQLRELASREAAAESERLVYVALTRARSRLIVSSHWWQPGRVRVKAPSQHLLDLTAMPAVAVGDWYEPAEGASN